MRPKIGSHPLVRRPAYPDAADRRPGPVPTGIGYAHAYVWDSAAVEFQTAVRLRTSDDIEPLVQYGRYLLFRGRTADALSQFLEARRTEPASAVVSSWLSYTYYLRGQLDSALVENARALQNDSTSGLALAFGALARLRAGDTVGALGLVNRLAPKANAVRLYVLAVTGDTAAALARLRELETERRPTRWLTATTRGLTMASRRATNSSAVRAARATPAYRPPSTTSAPAAPRVSPNENGAGSNLTSKRSGTNRPWVRMRGAQHVHAHCAFDHSGPSPRLKPEP